MSDSDLSSRPTASWGTRLVDQGVALFRSFARPESETLLSLNGEQVVDRLREREQQALLDKQPG